jgi:hypothetical protein
VPSSTVSSEGSGDSEGEGGRELRGGNGLTAVMIIILEEGSPEAGIGCLLLIKREASYSRLNKLLSVRSLPSPSTQDISS